MNKKNKLLKIRKLLTTTGVATTLAISICGCGADYQKRINIKNIQENYNDGFDLFGDERDMFIVQTKNAVGNKAYHLVYRYSLEAIAECHHQDFGSTIFDFSEEELEKLEKYIGKPIESFDTAYYDVLNGQLISIMTNMNTYKINNIESLDFACNYATAYLGVKEKYTKEEIEGILEKLNRNLNEVKETEKQKVKNSPEKKINYFIYESVQKKEGSYERKYNKR